MCLQNNAQSFPAKPASSPNTATMIAPVKSTVSPQTEPSEQVTDEKAKTPYSAPTADKSDSKVVRRRRSIVKGGAAAVALATKRATRRSFPAETNPDSTQTSVVVTATDDLAVVKKRRGRKPRSVPTESITGITMTDSPTASHKQDGEANDRESAAGTNTTSTVKEKSPVPSEPKDLITMSQEIVSKSCGDSGEATKPVTTRKKACKVTNHCEHISCQAGLSKYQNT